MFYHYAKRGQITNPQDLIGLTGVYPAIASYGRELGTLIQSELTTAEFKDNFAMLGALVKNRFDYAILPKLDGEAMMSRIGLEGTIIMSSFSLAKNNVHFSFSRNSSCRHLFDSFNSALQELALSDQDIQAMLIKARDVYFREVNAAQQ